MPSLSQNVNKKTATALAVAGIFFGIAVSATGYTIFQLRAAQAWVEHTHEVMSGCKELLLSCLDIETGERGYVATGNEKFLEPLKNSIGNVERRSDYLISLTSDDPEESRRMAELKKTAMAKLKFVNDVLTAYSHSTKAGIELTGTMKGKELMDQIRDLIAQAQQHQENLLVAREDSVTSLQNWVAVMIAVFTLLEAGSLVYIYNLTRTYSQDQLKRTEELEAEIKLRQDTENSLREATIFLKRSNQDLQQFAYVASHDLQEPLRAVQGFTTLLAKTYKGKLDEQGDAWVEQVVSGVDRMRTLINGLLQYARVESRGAEMQQVDLNTVVQQVLGDIKMKIDETEATVKVETLPAILGDAEQLRMLFNNLISNAIKYRSERKPAIEISAVKIEPNWQICIEDNGIGFDMQHQEKIFVIFQRLHSRNQYEGTGIGLALCRRIAERHRGSITAISTIDVGSKFLIKFPIISNSASTAALRTVDLDENKETA